MQPISPARTRAAALLLAAVMVPGPVAAADLLEAYRDATVYDAQFAAARAARDALLEQLPQARAALLPAVGLAASTTRTDLDAEYDTVPGPTPDRRDFDTTVYTLSLVQPLYRKSDFARYGQAEYAVREAEAEYQAAKQDLILRVAEAYFGVLAAQDALDVIVAQKAAIAEQLARAKRGFEVGAATITDTHEAQARFDLALAQEIAARSALDLRLRALQQLTGKSYGALRRLRPELVLEPPGPDELSRWVSLGREQSFAVIAQEARVEQQALEVIRQRAGHYPTLDLIASYSDVDHTGTIILPTPGRLSTGAIGLQLNLPLYAGGAVLSRTREAAARLEQARADLDHARRRQALAVEQNFVNVVSGISQVRALEQALVSSETALASNKRGHEVGVRITIDVLNAQQQVYSTRRELAAARYNTILSQLRLQAAVGNLDEADLEAINRTLTAADR